MSYSESESDFSFVINSVSDFGSDLILILFRLQ